jgi:negative regulator of sigma E activity
MMDRLENELREALRREEPPPGFAERVLAAAEAQAGPRQSVWDWFRMPAMRWALAAAACLALAAGITAVREKREREMRARSEEAKAQVMLALRITGSKLHMVQAKVARINEGRRPARPPERHL